MAAQTPFRRLRDTGQLLRVDMDDLKVYFPGTGMRGIGTNGLNGCTCVVILGRTAILMAHISPYPGQFQQNPEHDILQANHDHHEQYMRNIEGMVKQYAAHFPSSSTAWGVFSENNVKSIERQVQSHLNAIGYTMRPAFYKKLSERQAVPPKGELVAFFQGPTPNCTSRGEDYDQRSSRP